jgi:hypothetical protein
MLHRSDRWGEPVWPVSPVKSSAWPVWPVTATGLTGGALSAQVFGEKEFNLVVTSIHPPLGTSRSFHRMEERQTCFLNSLGCPVYQFWHAVAPFKRLHLPPYCTPFPPLHLPFLHLLESFYFWSDKEMAGSMVYTFLQCVPFLSSLLYLFWI